MATQTYEWIISARARGFDTAAAEVRRATSQIDRDLDAAQRRVSERRASSPIGSSGRPVDYSTLPGPPAVPVLHGPPNPSVFSTLPLTTVGNAPSQQNLHGIAQQFNDLERTAAKLKAAQIAGTIAAIKRLDPDDPAHDAARARIPALQEARRHYTALGTEDGAAKAHARALAADTVALNAAAEADRRRALFGEHHEKLINKAGYLNYPPKSDPQYASLRDAVASAHKERADVATIQARREQEEDLADRERTGHNNTIQRKRDEAEAIALREETGRNSEIQRKRDQAHDLAIREETGRNNDIQRRREQAEALALREETGHHSDIQRQRDQAEALALREKTGHDSEIQRKRDQAHDLALREETGRNNDIQRRRDQAEALALREQTGHNSMIQSKREQTDDLALRDQRAADAEGQRQQARYNSFQAPFANPDLSTKVGMFRDKVNEAERLKEIATNKRTDLLGKANVDAGEMHAAEKAYAATTRNALTARTQLAEVERRAAITQRGFVGRTRGQFMEGFRGASDRPYAEQIGQAFKFSVFYGTAYKLLFALTTTLTATLQEGIEFQQAMTELKIASGQSADAANDMADGLGAQATAAGLAPSQGVILGSRSLGLFGATEAAGASLAEQNRIATISAHVISRMALGSKTSPEELQTQVAAVANAFGGGAAGQVRAFDLDAYFGRQFGVQQGMTVQSVAESGTVGQAAGFDQEQVSAIAAFLQSRTGQTPSAVAGWMAQIFSRGGEGSLTNLTKRYDIDQSADLATQIQELAAVYKNASSSERAELAAGFGRGKVQNAAVVLLEGLDTVLATAEASRTDATGEGDRIFDLKLGNIGGQIALTVSTMKAFASELGQTGLLDVLGGVVVVFRELTEAATGVLKVWNEIPQALKTAIVALGLFTVALRIGAGVSALGGAGGLVGKTAGLAGFTRTASSAGGLVGLSRAAGGAGAVAGAAGGAGLLASAGPWVAAAAGLWAIGELKNTSESLRIAQENAADALVNSDITSTSTGDDYNASASHLDTLAKESREASGWFMQFVSAGAADDDNQELADALELEAHRRRKLAALIDKSAADMAEVMSESAPAITSWDAEGLSTSLDLITASGGTATERLDALITSLHGTADAAVAAAGAMGPEFAGKIATTFRDNVSDVRQDVPLWMIPGNPAVSLPYEYQVDSGKNLPYQTDGGAPIYETRSLDEVYQPSAYQIQQRTQKALDSRGLTSKSELDKKTRRSIAEEVITANPADYDSGLSAEDLAEVRELMIGAYIKELKGEAVAWRALLKENKELSKSQLTVAIDGIMAEFEGKREDLPETGPARAKNSRAQLRELLDAQKTQKNGFTPAMIRAIGNARNQVAVDEIERLEEVRRAGQQNAKTGAEVAAWGRRTMKGRIRAAVKNGNRDTLAAALLASGDGAIEFARKVIANVIATVNAALQVEAEMRATASALVGGLGGMAGLLGVSAETMAGLKELDRLKGQQSALDTLVVGDGKNDLTGADVAGPEKFFEEPKAPKAGKSPEDRKAEREAARQEMLDLKNNLYLLSIDLTDPLAQAVAAVKDARRRLQSDIGSGQDKGTVAASRVALRQAQNEREATAFQQRLDAVTTAEELGRISHRKYISYLQNESRRLNAIKNRTFQQQQQLDSIDRLMMSAADSMQGMWNFGDIKLPTPLQIRKQVEGLQAGQHQFDPGALPGHMSDKTRKQIERDRSDRATQLDATSRQRVNNSTIYIDGADTGKVRQIIHEVLDKSNATVTNRPRRR